VARALSHRCIWAGWGSYCAIAFIRQSCENDGLQEDSPKREFAMRILMVVRQFFPWVGGTERQAQKLSKKLRQKGVDVKIVTGWWQRDTPQQEVIDTVPVFRNLTLWEMFGIRGLRKFGGYIYIVSLLYYLWRHRREYDLLHIHMLSYPAFAGVLAGKWLGKKTVVKIANSGWGSDIKRMRENGLVPGSAHMLPIALRGDRMVAVNSRIVDELRESRVESERIAVIPNGVDVNGVTGKKDYRLNGVVTLVFVGRLDPQKGLDVLLPAFQQVRSLRPELCWRLLLIGDGLLRDELKNVARQLNIAEYVEFCGLVRDVDAHLSQADLFVLPSRSEGMSNALLEAMTLGLPCVATRISGNTDLIQDGENGVLVLSENVDSLAQAFMRLVEDEALRSRLGNAARRTVASRYSLDSIADRYIGLYRALLEE
jgi:glycosyltransferase involved in cell wall biosynthesis